MQLKVHLHPIYCKGLNQVSIQQLEKEISHLEAQGADRLKQVLDACSRETKLQSELEEAQNSMHKLVFLAR